MPGDGVLVLGAAGFLGQHVVDALRAEGVEPRCGRRARGNVLGLRARRATMVVADLDEPATLDAAMAGCGTVVHVAGHYPRLSTDRDATLARGLRQTDAVVRAARAAGVRRLVYVSSTATVRPVPGRPSAEADRYPAPPGVGVYHDLKWAMEARLDGVADLDVRVALPSGCVGPGDLRFGTAGMLLALARGDDPPHPDGTVSLVDPRDAAVGIARLARVDDAPRRLVLSAVDARLHALLVRLADRYGVAPPRPPLDPEAAVALADRAEAEVAGTPRRPAMSREIVDLALHSAVVDGTLATRALGVRYRPFAETLDDFDAWARRLGALPPSPPEARP